MHSLLSKRDQRHLRFLELLMKHDSLTLEEASALAEYPVRTLAEDIGHINSYIFPSQIRTSSSGIQLYIPTESSIRDVYSKLLRQSREYQLLVYLFYNKGKTQEELSDSQYVSISTMQRIIKAMNAVLAQRNIILKSKPARMEVTGDERQIALLYISLFSEWYYDDTGPMLPKEKELLQQLNQKMSGNNRFTLYYAEMKRVSLWVYVRLMRIRQGYLYPRGALREENLACLVLNDTAFCQRFEQVFGIKLSSDLLYNLYDYFLRVEYANSMEELRAIKAHSPRLSKLDADIQGLLERVAASFSISDAGTEVLRLILFNTLQVPDTPPYVLYNKYTIFVEEYKKSNAPAAKIILGHIRQQFPRLTNADEIHRIARMLITHWPSLIQEIERSAPDVYVGVFFDTDIEHANMISDLIRVKSSVKVHVLVADAAKASSLELWCRNIDVMITNIPFLKTTCAETICIQEYPNTKDWASIAQAMERINRQKWLAGANGG